jgi:hypothetical protein
MITPLATPEVVRAEVEYRLERASGARRTPTTHPRSALRSWLRRRLRPAVAAPDAVPAVSPVRSAAGACAP